MESSVPGCRNDLFQSPYSWKYRLGPLIKGVCEGIGMAFPVLEVFPITIMRGKAKNE